LIDFSANINPLGPPAGVWQAIREALPAIVAYPDPKARQLKNALAEKLKLEVEQIAVGNGAAEILYAVLRALRPQTVGLIQPSFTEYREAADLLEARIIAVQTEDRHDFRPDLSELLAVCEQADLFIAGYPNNPDGQLLPIDWLVQMAEVLRRHGGYLLVDEAFIDFVPMAKSMLDQLDQYPNVTLLRSMTKYYAIPGLRLGYALADRTLIQRFERELPPWSVNGLAQAAGRAALTDERFEQRTREWLRAERPFLLEGLGRLAGIKVYRGEANFILFRCGCPDLQTRLGRAGILIRSCANYPGLSEQFYRIAVRSREENQRLLEQMARLMGRVQQPCPTY
jgi:threonine-phosphate decarboxylase